MSRRRAMARRLFFAHHLTNDRGALLLLEVVIAMFLLSLAIIPIFYSLGIISISAESSRFVTVAMNLLQQEAENIKFEGYYAATSTLLEHYDGTAFAVEVIVTPTNMPGVVKVVLHAYREPLGPESVAVARMEFLLYEKGF